MKCITCFFVVLTIKTVFKGVAGGIVIFSAFELLRRGSTYDQLVTAINNCVLPASAKLIQMAEGSVNLKVQVESAIQRLHNRGLTSKKLCHYYLD